MTQQLRHAEFFILVAIIFLVAAAWSQQRTAKEPAVSSPTEASPTATPTPAPSPIPEKPGLWISQEEYDFLRQTPTPTIPPKIVKEQVTPPAKIPPPEDIVLDGKDFVEGKAGLPEKLYWEITSKRFLRQRLNERASAVGADTIVVTGHTDETPVTSKGAAATDRAIADVLSKVIATPDGPRLRCVVLEELEITNNITLALLRAANVARVLEALRRIGYLPNIKVVRFSSDGQFTDVDGTLDVTMPLDSKEDAAPRSKDDSAGSEEKSARRRIVLKLVRTASKANDSAAPVTFPEAQIGLCLSRPTTRIEEVLQGSRATFLAPGDVIESVNDVKVKDGGFNALQAFLSDRLPGTDARITFWRYDKWGQQWKLWWKIAPLIDNTVVDQEDCR